MALKNRTTHRDFVPGARIYLLIKEPVFDSFGKVIVRPEYIKIDEFLDVSVTCGIGRINSASITLSNLGDRWFNKARRVKKNNVRQKEIINYLNDVLAISEVRERNRERRADYYELLLKSKIVQQSRKKSKYLERADNGSYTQGPIPQSRAEEYSNYEFLSTDFEKMRRIWIDFRDRDGNWVPGFTGYLSSMQTIYTAGQIGIVSLNCKGLGGLLQRSEIIISQAIDPSYEPFKESEIPSIGFSFMTNSLANQDGEQIIETVVRLAQDTFCYNFGNYFAQKNSTDYFYQERLWALPGDSYAGETAVAASFGPLDMAYEPRRYWDEGTPLPELLGKLIIDPEVIRKDRNRFRIFQKAIQTAFQLYQNKPMYAWTIIQRVAATVGYDFFEDPKGNLVFQVPKYDKLPRLKGDRKISIEDLKLSGLDGPSETYGIMDGYEPVYTENYSNVPYHNRDYILDQIGMKSRRYIDTEDGLMTFVTTHSVCDYWQNADETTEIELFTGYTSYPRMVKLSQEIADQIVALNRRYGVRRQDMQPIVSGSLSGDRDILDRWALQSLININSNVKSGTVALDQRPDLWIGRTVFLVEDQKLAYIVGTTNTYNKSGRQPHDTQLSLAFIHHPDEVIGIPWHLATENADVEISTSGVFIDEPELPDPSVAAAELEE